MPAHENGPYGDDEFESRSTKLVYKIGETDLKEPKVETRTSTMPVAPVIGRYNEVCRQINSRQGGIWRKRPAFSVIKAFSA